MPKIKDLGINVIPETMRPPEIGGGGACPACSQFTVNCIGCTAQITACICTDLSVCQGCSHITNPCIGCTAQITACICTDLSVCHGCTHITNPCFGCTQTPTVCACTDLSLCHGCTHITNPCIGCTARISVCACSALASQCTFGSHTITITPTTPQIAQAGGLTREHVAALREQLKQSLSALDDAEKAIGPQTADAIDKREQEIKAELEQLKARRAQLSKK